MLFKRFVQEIDEQDGDRSGHFSDVQRIMHYYSMHFWFA